MLLAAQLEARMHDVVRVRRGGQFGIARGLGCVLEAHQHLDLDAERLLVELERLVGAAVEEQIDLVLHGWFLVPEL